MRQRHMDCRTHIRQKAWFGVPGMTWKRYNQGQRLLTPPAQPPLNKQALTMNDGETRSTEFR